MSGVATLAEERMVLMPTYIVQETKTYEIKAESRDEAMLAISDEDSNNYIVDEEITVDAI